MIQITKQPENFILILGNSWVKEGIEVEIVYYLELKTTFIKSYHLSKSGLYGQSDRGNFAAFIIVLSICGVLSF